MEYLVNREKMKEIDRRTIQEVGIPSLVLMERAAFSVVLALEKRYGRQQRVLCVCGTGNNGADGVAVARILHERGQRSAIYIPVESEHSTEEWKRQIEIAQYLGIPVLRENLNWREYTVLVDALFGIGLSREVRGNYQKVIKEMNDAKVPILAVDIPSGICSTTGKVLGDAVKADLTVTFGVKKTGLVYFPGAFYAGEVLVENPGFPKEVIDRCKTGIYTYTREDLKELPKRAKDGNKGTFGKVAVIAGTKDMAGAAYFSAMAAYRMGAGLVRICTCEENRIILQTKIPEAVLSTYTEDTVKEKIKEAMEWADVIAAGPGLGQSEMAKEMVKCVLDYAWEYVKKPIVLDADGLNLFAKMEYPCEKLAENVIFTPHLGEFSRLSNCSIAEIKENLEQKVRDYTEKYPVCLVCKDARTVVMSYNKGDEKECGMYLNSSGCNGMGTGGSGDVLTGVIAGMLAMGLTGQKAAEMGVYFHGLAGEMAAAKVGEHALCASDILDGIVQVWKEIESGRFLIP